MHVSKKSKKLQDVPLNVAKTVVEDNYQTSRYGNILVFLCTGISYQVA